MCVERSAPPLEKRSLRVVYPCPVVPADRSSRSGNNCAHVDGQGTLLMPFLAEPSSSFPCGPPSHQPFPLSLECFRSHLVHLARSDPPSSFDGSPSVSVLTLKTYRTSFVVGQRGLVEFKTNVRGEQCDAHALSDPSYTRAVATVHAEPTAFRTHTYTLTCTRTRLRTRM